MGDVGWEVALVWRQSKTAGCLEQTQHKQILSVLLWGSVWSWRGQDAMKEGHLGQFYQTGDSNRITEAHTDIYVKVHKLELCRTCSTDKSDEISLSKSDRQVAYLFQTRSHCLKDTEMLRQAWLTCSPLSLTLKGQQRQRQICLNISCSLLFFDT